MVNWLGNVRQAAAAKISAIKNLIIQTSMTTRMLKILEKIDPEGYITIIMNMNARQSSKRSDHENT